VSEPFLGEVKIISWNFAPKGWAFCNGQLLPINQNQALFSVLGTTYGGDGIRTFGLPNLQGRTPLHFGNGFVVGQLGGEAAHTVNIAELPNHTHTPVGTTTDGDSPIPTGNYLGAADHTYATLAPPVTTLPAGTVSVVGGSQPHNNLQPYLVLNFIIALQGIFPSQN
jgi:microcystin-dependent protein